MAFVSQGLKNELTTELEQAKGNVTELDGLKRTALNIESDLTREKMKKTFLSAEV